MKKYYSILLILFLSLSGLTSALNWKRYEDPQKKFSISIPKACDKTNVEKSLPDYSGVSFSNTFGDLIRLEVIQNDNLSITESDDKTKNKFFDISFKLTIFDVIQAKFPKTSVVSKDFYSDDEIGTMLFVVLNIPEGATLLDLSNGKRLDSIRGYLVSFSSNQVVILSSQYPPFNFCYLTSEEIKERLFRELLQIRKSYKNENPA